MTDDLYFCPSAREVESATGGGFATCCDRPGDHLPMPDGPATAAVSEALSSAAKTEFNLRQQLAELNNAITWETTCLNCSRLLTRSYEDYCRADALAAAVLSVSNELTQSGSHDAAGRLGDALDRYQETAGEQPNFPLPLRPDGTHFYVSTYCLHSDHAACRLTCLCCGQPCQCQACQHGELCTICNAAVEPLGMVLHFRAEHATAETLAESTPASTGPFEGAEIGIGEDGTFAWRCGGGQGCKGWVGLGLSSEDAAWAEFRGHVSREHASAGEERR